MKYVRVYENNYVEDEYLTTYQEHCEYVANIQDNGFDFEGHIIKQSDSIEELVDGFWWENTAYKEPIFIPNFGLVLDRVKAWKENDKELDDNSFDRITIYGSIYIHGYGWKHVCKVNKNEERLELL